MAIDVLEMARRYRSLYAAAVYDVLDEMGYPAQCLSLAIRPLRRDMVVAGPAFTVVGRRDPRVEGEFNNPKLEDFRMLEAITAGSVIVVNAESGNPVGHWGDLMSAAARARGAVGIVIDGGIRDSRILLEMEDWPVFVRYTSPIESDKRWRVEDFQTPIAMSGSLTSQVRVNPGDWIFGDADGVIVMPAHLAEEVLVKAEAIKQMEDKVRGELSTGARVKEVFDRYKRL
ncbi:MAG: dimethylmenaquinone methyltransferase [Bacillota bacterium]